MSSKPKAIEIVQTVEEFQQIIGFEKEQLVAVLYAAPWCRACKAVTPKFLQLAQRYAKIAKRKRRQPSQSTPKFVQVPVSQDNMNVLKGLGVEKFPMYQLYHPQHGLVASGPFLRKVVHEFEDTLRWHLNHA